ncbi:hypothetical protein PHMEG_0001460 [Phytophthora megakarya]|uniref:Uncharacterized protein n=1 Tax=Phytophthora megakarya TaxID=4795 RepID=A0A225X2Y1_9STRA|nr:hypothetical protein PHMEG_0001460 [Phytophthora megakarya]
MFFPKQSCDATKWTPANCIEHARKLGNEYVSAHVPVISNTLKCNHDVKLLAAGEGPHKSYYVMKYSVKPQNDIENPAALHLHASMCCTRSNGQEVAAPMAALYLLREAPFYASHKFAPLHLDSIVGALFNSEEDTVVLEQAREGMYKPTSVLTDYCCRPTTMENICLMEFKRHWKKKRDTKGVLFQETHPQYSTHSIHCLPTEAVVTVFSSRLPDIRKSYVDNKVKLNYRERLLALFMPFRLQSGFDVVDERVVSMFDAWWRTPEADLAPVCRF